MRNFLFLLSIAWCSVEKVLLNFQSSLKQVLLVILLVFKLPSQSFFSNSVFPLWGTRPERNWRELREGSKCLIRGVHESEGDRTSFATQDLRMRTPRRRSRSWHCFTILQSLCWQSSQLGQVRVASLFRIQNHCFYRTAAQVVTFLESFTFPIIKGSYFEFIWGWERKCLFLKEKETHPVFEMRWE